MNLTEIEEDWWEERGQSSGVKETVTSNLVRK